MTLAQDWLGSAMWMLFTGVFLASAVQAYIGFNRKGRIAMFLFGNVFLFLAMGNLAFGLALGPFPAMLQYSNWINRLFVSLAVMHAFLGTDAYLASTNNHLSIVQKFMSPIETAWREHYAGQ